MCAFADTDQVCVIKQVDLTDLPAAEKEAAENEVTILARLQHPVCREAGRRQGDHLLHWCLERDCLQGPFMSNTEIVGRAEENTTYFLKRRKM